MIDRSQISDEIPPIALSLLQTVSGNAAEKLGLRLDPAVQFLASAYPVDKIWQAHQVSNLLELEDTLDVGSGSVFLQIRGNHEQTIVSLTPSIWIFRTSLSQGHSLVTATGKRRGPGSAPRRACSARRIISRTTGRWAYLCFGECLVTTDRTRAYSDPNTRTTTSGGLWVRILALRDRLDRFPSSLLGLILRASVANVFWRSGQTNLPAGMYRMPRSSCSRMNTRCPFYPLSSLRISLRHRRMFFRFCCFSVSRRVFRPAACLP